MKTKCSSKGFTLVEIMIVVVIIGLLAMIAIPARQGAIQKSRRTTMLNDARQIGSAAQQYMADNHATSVNFKFTPSSGVTQAPLSNYVPRVGEGYTNGDITITAEGSFSLQHPHVRGGIDGNGNLGDPVNFSASGQLRAN